MLDKVLSQVTKVAIGVGLAFWAIGIGIGLYVGFNVIVLDKDFGSGRFSGKRIQRLEKIHDRLHHSG